MLSSNEILRFLALPAAMAAFILASQLAGGLTLRTVASTQVASLR